MSSFLSRLDPRRSGYQWLLENSCCVIPKPVTCTNGRAQYLHTTKRRKLTERTEIEGNGTFGFVSQKRRSDTHQEVKHTTQGLAVPRITNRKARSDPSRSFAPRHEDERHDPNKTKSNDSFFTPSETVEPPQPCFGVVCDSITEARRRRDRFHGRWLNTIAKGPIHNQFRTKSSRSASPIRTFTTTSRTTEPAAAAAAIAHDFSRDELDWLVDQYGFSGEEQKPYERIAPASKPPQQEEPETEPRYFDSRAPSSKDMRERLRDFHSLLAQNPPHEKIFDMYRTLTLDELRQFPVDILHQLLMHLSTVELRDQASMMRYLAVVEDMRKIDVPLSRGELTSAIMFVGHCFKKISNEHVEMALDRWKSMEGESKIKANTATFNALFGIATKARKFVLADMIWQEMETRGLEMDRTSRVQLIHYYGLKKDSTGVRKAYKSLVRSGEIVDTSAVSCVIQSLLLCRENVAAEMVFHRMKRLDAEKSNRPLPPSDRQNKKMLRRVLTKCGPLVQEDPAIRQQTQDATPLAPNEQTYNHFIYHYSVRTSNFERIVQLVNEMEWYNVSLSGRFFFYIFQGFARHGSTPFSAWTWPRLETVFDAFIRGVDIAHNGDPWGYIEANPNPKLYVGQPLAEVCLKAFAKCSRDENRVREVWDQLEQRWHPDEKQSAEIDQFIHNLMEKTRSKMPSIRDVLRA